jgi:hypothetical protein
MSVMAKMSKATSAIKRSSTSAATPNATASEVDSSHGVAPNEVPPVSTKLRLRGGRGKVERAEAFACRRAAGKFASSCAVACAGAPPWCSLRHHGHARLARLQVKLTLGDASLTFIDGMWETGISAATGAARPRAPNSSVLAKHQAEVSKLQKENANLQSEVNLLKFKVPLA